MFDNYQYYFNQAITLEVRGEVYMSKSTLEMLITQHEQTLRDKKQSEEYLKNLILKESQYELAVDLMKKIIEGMSQSQINHLEVLINSALETIFFDRKYFVELQVTELRNTNNLQILLNEVNDNGELIKTDIKSNGFGVQSIIGFILQLYFILYYKQYPVMFMDEAMTQLSKQYLPYFKILINDLAEKYNFIFVLVTHDRDIMELSDRTYEVVKGEVRLINEV